MWARLDLSRQRTWWVWGTDCQSRLIKDVFFLLIVSCK
jgi:hypothetical protein